MIKKIFVSSIVASSVYLKYQSIKKKRSIQSIIFELGIKNFWHGLDARTAIKFEKMNRESYMAYELPQKVENNLGFEWLDERKQVLKRDGIVSPVRKVIFYIHGVTFCQHPTDLQYKFVTKIADRVGASIVMPVYPKAPAKNVDDALSMIMRSYQELLSSYAGKSENIIILGDALGGGLAISLLEQLRDAQISLPKQAILLSPWLDASLTNPAIEDVSERDSVLNLDELHLEATYYAGDEELKSPVVSPIYGELDNLPNITIFGGTEEILYPDMKLFTEKVKENVELFTYKGMFHLFQLFPLPESKRVIEQITDLIQYN